jgi:hypothetical protein
MDSSSYSRGSLERFPAASGGLQESAKDNASLRVPVQALLRPGGFRESTVAPAPIASGQGRVVPLSSWRIRVFSQGSQDQALPYPTSSVPTQPLSTPGAHFLDGWITWNEAPDSFSDLVAWISFLFSRQLGRSLISQAPEVLSQDLNKLRVPPKLASGHFYGSAQYGQDQALSILVRNDAIWGSCSDYVDFQVYEQALLCYEKALLSKEPLAPETLHNMMHCIYKHLWDLALVDEHFWLALSIERDYELGKLCFLGKLLVLSPSALVPYVKCLVDSARTWLFNYKESLYKRSSVLSGIAEERDKALYECHHLYQELRWLCLGEHYAGGFAGAIRRSLTVCVPLIEQRWGSMLNSLVGQQSDEWQELLRAKACLGAIQNANHTA